MNDSLIEDAAHRIFVDLADPQSLAAADDLAEVAARDRLWGALETAGLTQAWTPELFGGAGASLHDGFAIARIAGRFASPVPLGETLLAGWLLSAVGLSAPAGPIAIAPLRDGDRLTIDGDGRVSGHVRAAPFTGPTAPNPIEADAPTVRDGVPSSAGGGLGWGPTSAAQDPASHLRHLPRRLAVYAADPDGRLTVALVSLDAASLVRSRIDLGADRADLAFERASPIASAPAPEALTPDHIVAMGAAVRAQQIAGALETVLHITTEYVQQRVAFGRTLSKFQAVQQSLARLAGEVAAALTASSSAADALGRAAEGAPIASDDLLLEVAAAKIRTGEAASDGAAIAHQAHGAIGFTDDYQLQLFSKALWGWRDDFGGETVWALRLGRAVAAAGSDAHWPALTRR